MKKILFILSLAVIFLNCSRKPAQRENVFRYNESKGIPTLDPAYARNQTIIWPVNQIFNGLVQVDDSLSILPCIASSWEVSEDRKIYSFHLRDDVFFHDHEIFPEGRGRKVNAHDFNYSFGRITDPAVASPGAWIFNNLDKNNISHPSGFQATNDSTFLIYLKNPFPAFLGILSMPYCFVVPREIVEHYADDFRNNPVGTGPFRFKFWREEEKLVLVRNETYFEKDADGRKLPYLDAIAISFIKDKQSEFMEFMLGNLDFLSGVHASYKDELITRSGNLNPEYADRINMLSQPYLNTEYLGILVDTNADVAKSSPLLDLKVRQAINYGFDRIRMMKFLRNNIGKPALQGIIPEGMPSFNPEKVKGYTYQPDIARELLAEAGYPGGKGLPEITLTTTSDYLDICEYIQHELSDLGIMISIDVNTGAAFRSRMANAKLSFFRGSWIADYPDAENYLSLFYSKNFSPTGPNYTHFSDRTFDSLFEISMLEGNEPARFEIYQKLDQIIVNQAVIVPLYYDRVVRFIPVDLEGLGTNPMNLLSLKKTYWLMNPKP